MKRPLLLLLGFFAGISSISAQLTQVVHELYGTRSTGEEVYRIYAELQDPTDFVSAVFAANNDALFLGSDIGGIVNDGFGSITGDVLGTGLCGIVADICMDSYVTIGHAGSPSSGTTVYWDDTTVIPCGQPVNAIATDPAPSIFSDAFGAVAGVDLEVVDGSWFSTNLAGCNDQGKPFGMNNRVLLAQVAVPVGGNLVYCLNIQIFDEAVGADSIEYVCDSATVDGDQVDGSGLGLQFPADICDGGCTDTTACNYDSNAPCDDGSCVYPGCTDPLACNYDMAAGCDDGSCDLTGGCTDTTACNYDSMATCDNGTCTYPGCTDSTACNYDPAAGCDDGSCDLEGGCTDTTACNYDTMATCDNGSCTYPGCTDSTACNYDPAAGCDDGSCLPGDGCTDTMACNYDSMATCDDGSCTYPGCVDSMACNYDSTAGCDDGSCTYPGCTDSMACNYDSTAGCDDGSCIMPDGCTDSMACNYDSMAVCDDGSCFYPDGCTDSMACNYDSMAMCDDGSCTYPGCTDSTACNYDSTAGCDDGSCMLPDGCTDETACNYDSMAMCDDGSCILPDGCTDSTACNYDSMAMCDDGSCTYPDGCTDETACNYDSTATCDDGSCILPDGCTDETACNYDSTAMCDDGSCILPDGCTDSTACNYDPNAMCDDGSCAEAPATGTITGEGSPLTGTTETYTYPDATGSTFTWTVTNGTIISGQGTNTIEVEWGDEGPGSVTVVETNEAGCDGEEVTLDTDVIVTINELMLVDFDVYPNPAMYSLTIDPGNLINERLQVNVLDATGKLVMTTSIQGKTLVDVNNLAAGVYTVRLISNSGIASEQVIIER